MQRYKKKRYSQHCSETNFLGVIRYDNEKLLKMKRLLRLQLLLLKIYGTTNEDFVYFCHLKIFSI